MEAVNDLSWMASALCAQTDPEIFFPEPGVSNKDAKETCMACEVRPECAEYTAEVDAEYGIWGVWAGKSVEERQRDSVDARARNAERSARRDQALFEASERAMRSGWTVAEFAAEIGTTAMALTTARVRHRRRLAQDPAA